MRKRARSFKYNDPIMILPEANYGIAKRGCRKDTSFGVILATYKQAALVETVFGDEVEVYQKYLIHADGKE